MDDIIKLRKRFEFNRKEDKIILQILKVNKGSKLEQFFPIIQILTTEKL